MYKYHSSWLHVDPYVYIILPGVYEQQHDFASHKFLVLHPTQIATLSFGSIAVNTLFAKVTKPILCETQKCGKDSKHFVSIPAKQQLVGY